MVEGAFGVDTFRAGVELPADETRLEVRVASPEEPVLIRGVVMGHSPIHLRKKVAKRIALDWCLLEVHEWRRPLRFRKWVELCWEVLCKRLPYPPLCPCVVFFGSPLRKLLLFL